MGGEGDPRGQPKLLDGEVRTVLANPGETFLQQLLRRLALASPPFTNMMDVGATDEVTVTGAS